MQFNLFLLSLLLSRIACLAFAVSRSLSDPKLNFDLKSFGAAEEIHLSEEAEAAALAVLEASAAKKRAAEASADAAAAEKRAQEILEVSRQRRQAEAQRAALVRARGEPCLLCAVLL